MRYYFVFMLSFLILSLSCSSSTTSTSKPGKGKQYLALGDSYTIGESVNQSQTYPQQLVDVWNENKEEFAPPTIIARTGWTTADLQRGIENANIAGKKYDKVSLLIGVNNEFQGRGLQEYEQQFAELLDQAIGFAKNKESVFVLSIPDYGFTPYGEKEQSTISPRIDQFNEVAKKITESKGIKFIDITPISRKGLSDPELVAKDGLHPSGKMYGEFVRLISTAEGNL